MLDIQQSSPAWISSSDKGRKAGVEVVCCAWIRCCKVDFLHCCDLDASLLIGWTVLVPEREDSGRKQTDSVHEAFRRYRCVVSKTQQRRSFAQVASHHVARAQGKIKFPKLRAKAGKA